jgi:hypothetical protein
MNSTGYNVLPPKLPMVWAEYSHRIWPTDPHIIQTTIILTLLTVETLATADVQIGPKLQKQ